MKTKASICKIKNRQVIKLGQNTVIPGSGVTANVRLSAQHNVAGFPPFVMTALSTPLRYERKANISP
ncbi:hypothetical protein J6590_102390, partial [Homalodisca vitripennis]